MKENVDRLMDELLRVRPENPELPWVPQLPVEVEGPVPDLCTAVERWLSDSWAPAIALLKGPIGTGKTLAACRLVRALCERHRRRVVYAALGKAHLGGDPQAAIVRQLGLPPETSLWRGRARLDLLVLDGVDEMLAQKGETRVCAWFNQLFDDQFRSVRVLISGRQEAFGEGGIYRRLDALLADRVAVDRPNAVPFEIRLKPWVASGPRAALEDLLPPHEELGELMRPDLAESQLLFGLAYAWLANRRGEAARGNPVVEPRPIDNEWELTSRLITQILSRQSTRSTRSSRDRRPITCAIAAYLALSGRGMAGVSATELRRLDRLWRDLR